MTEKVRRTKPRTWIEEASTLSRAQRKITELANACCAAKKRANDAGALLGQLALEEGSTAQGNFAFRSNVRVNELLGTGYTAADMKHRVYDHVDSVCDHIRPITDGNIAKQVELAQFDKQTKPRRSQ